MAKTRTLQQTLLLRVVPLTLVALIAIVWVTRYSIRRTVAQEVSNRMQQNATITAIALADRLNLLRGTAKTLAANDLLINSIVDKSQREGQLVVFLRSLQLPSPAFRHVTMLDYRGRAVMTNGNANPLPVERFIETVMSGQDYFEIDEDSILIVAPVQYGGSPEAALAIEYDTTVFLDDFLTTDFDHEAQLFDEGQRLYRSSEFNLGDDRWIWASRALPGYPGLQIRQSERQSVAFGSIKNLDLFFLGVLAACAASLILAVSLVTRGSTRQLSLLAEQIQEIQEDNDLSRLVDVNETSEFQSLSDSFNRLIDSLSQTTVSRDLLQSSENRLRAVVDHAPGGIIGTDHSGTITLVNDATENIFGYDRSELIGRPITMLIPDALSNPDDTNDTVDLHPQFSFRSWDGVRPAAGRRRGGEAVFLEFGLSPVEWSDGSGLLATVVDVTKRRQQQQENERLRRETQLILDSIPATVLFKDRHNRILRVNRAGAEMVGLPPEQIEGHSTGDFFADYHAYYKDDLEVMRSGKPRLGIIERVSIENKDTRWASTDKIPIFDAEGELAGIIAVINDITELKNAQAELEEATRVAKESEERLRLTVRSASIGMWDWDVGTSNVRINRELSMQLGEELAYENFEGWQRRVHPADLPEVEKAIGDCLEGRATDYESTFRMRHRDGSYRWILSRGKLAERNDDRPLRMIGVHIDITDRKINEVALQRANLELKRSNDELAQFAYVASHDLQEPLRKITSFCELLDEECEGQLNEDAQRFMKYIVDGAHRMRTLIQDLLSFSRIESQGKPLVDVDANDAARRALENLSHAIQESNAQVEIDDLPVVRADPTQLAQLFQNLIGNAIKYRSEAAPRVHVCGESRHDKWVLSVSDNGIGIDPKYHKQIFGVFKRLHSMDTYKGTGIGLAICRRIVDRLDGEIRIESEPSKGSTFYVEIPRPVETQDKADAMIQMRLNEIETTADA
ncbi:PAS domain S-box protein [Crateriforma conspicua]|uniref:histidine kinase n=1 Tax=Crateriforma conspicua TaxID=2527996 RepID=A0A5C5Y1M5_9PLAN|nr:PAS domain S-box protein [Crateriforma conspicua]TWT68531.1 Phytochrome-like protein cph1 [Crateriforma conspicua]